MEIIMLDIFKRNNSEYVKKSDIIKLANAFEEYTRSSDFTNKYDGLTVVIMPTCTKAIQEFVKAICENY